jgi:hypothetical protein
MRIKLDLDPQLADALIDAAQREIRHPHQQAEAILRQSLGLPFPVPPKKPLMI